MTREKKTSSILTRQGGRQTRRITLYLSPSVARALKIHCAREDITMSEIADKALRRELDPTYETERECELLDNLHEASRMAVEAGFEHHEFNGQCEASWGSAMMKDVLETMGEYKASFDLFELWNEICDLAERRDDVRNLRLERSDILFDQYMSVGWVTRKMSIQGATTFFVVVDPPLKE